VAAPGEEMMKTRAACSARAASQPPAPRACADCLVPENLMRGILGQALGVPEDTID